MNLFIKDIYFSENQFRVVFNKYPNSYDSFIWFHYIPKTGYKVSTTSLHFENYRTEFKEAIAKNLLETLFNEKERVKLLSNGFPKDIRVCFL